MAKDGKNPRRAPHSPVLILVHADGFVEVFADRSIDAIVINVPDCPGHEALAEYVAELLNPPKYRALFRADRLRATGVARKFKPSALLAARNTALSIAQLNSASGGRR